MKLELGRYWTAQYANFVSPRSGNDRWCPYCPCHTVAVLHFGGASTNISRPSNHSNPSSSLTTSRLAIVRNKFASLLGLRNHHGLSAIPTAIPPAAQRSFKIARSTSFPPPSIKSASAQIFFNIIMSKIQNRERSDFDTSRSYIAIL